MDNSKANSHLSTESSDPHSVIDREPNLNCGELYQNFHTCLPKRKNITLISSNSV
jgi:hypothetical protein